MKYLRIVSIAIIVIAVPWFLYESRESLDNQEIVASANNNPSQWNEPHGELSRSDDGEGRVTMTAEYKPDSSTESITAFEVYLNTHSIDLDMVDFSNDIIIRKDGQEITPISVEILGVGHHRSAKLAFPQTETPFEIVGKNIAGITERSITWE